jgi:hypothetical protein
MSESKSVAVGLVHRESDGQREGTADGLTMISCSLCGKNVALEPGDVIYGTSWFHLNCWQSQQHDGEGSDPAIETLLLEEHKAQLRL